MAHNDTNTPKEARRHAGPLIGMAALVLIVAVGFVWWLAQATEGDVEPPAAAAPVVQQNQ